ncbi:MAG TPA: methyltransferase domain-containing protein [Longimicrobiales bacterium]|nr:methyltransferase domain-containing protein [Longimicrobiales bacterium]
MQLEQFEAHARLEERHWWFTARRAILLRILQAIARPGSPVADVGCGTGGNAAALARAGYEVLGLDPSPEAIALAVERFPKVGFRCTDRPADARAHLARQGTLLMTDVLEHVEGDRELLHDAVEATPRGGHLLLTVPADPSLWSGHDVAFGHKRRYVAASFRALWAEEPVAERLCSHYNARLWPLIAAVRRVGTRGGGGGDLDVPVGPLNAVFRAVFQSEAGALVSALDRGAAPFARGVSLVALLRKQ